MPIDVSVCCLEKVRCQKKKKKTTLFSVLINLKQTAFKNLTINNTLYNLAY